MKALIAPMEVMAETSGPMGRTRKLALELKARGHEVALCSAQSVNYRAIDGVKNYLAPTPSPLGLPPSLGRRVFGTAQRLGMQRRARVASFEQVLFMVGALSARHFAQDVAVLRKAITDFDPDVIHAEFRLSAIVAARLEGRPVATGHSFPTQASFASSPKRSRKLRQMLRSQGFPAIESMLEVFDWADIKIVPSSPDLEPMEGDKVVFTGPFSSITPQKGERERTKVVAYMGNGTVTARQQLALFEQAFADGHRQVCLASAQLPAGTFGPVLVQERFDFAKLFAETAVFVSHGGQNSIMDGLVAGIPQIVCPGMVFERVYNARSVEQLGAGKLLGHKRLTPHRVRSLVEDLCDDPGYAQSARKAGQELLSLGGAGRAAEALESLQSSGLGGSST